MSTTTKNALKYVRGGCFYANLTGYTKSAVQSGYRPVVLVSSARGLMSSDLVQVVPLTTKHKALSINPALPAYFLSQTSYALCNQIQVIPKSALGKEIGRFNADTMKAVDSALCIALGIIEEDVLSLRSSQDALKDAREDRAKLEELLPEAKELIAELNAIYLRQSSPKNPINKKRKKTARTQEEIESFIKEWENPHNKKKEVATVFDFNSPSQALQFYYRVTGKKKPKTNPSKPKKVIKK